MSVHVSGPHEPCPDFQGHEEREAHGLRVSVSAQAGASTPSWGVAAAAAPLCMCGLRGRTSGPGSRVFPYVLVSDGVNSVGPLWNGAGDRETPTWLFKSHSVDTATGRRDWKTGLVHRPSAAQTTPVGTLPRTSCRVLSRQVRGVFEKTEGRIGPSFIGSQDAVVILS